MIRIRALVVVATLVASRPAAAQLRPLEPIPWRVLEQGTTVTAELGVSRLYDQRASLAGTTGTLTELGNFSLAWHTGRVALEAAGTEQRIFNEKSRFADPYPDVEPATDRRRHDSGDYRILTSVRLTPDTYPITAVVRFGTRLPTTDNTTGLDRDATDFFATVGASGTRGIVDFSGEAGLGIYGTRETRFEQDDLFLYELRAETHLGMFTPDVMVVGQQHGYAHRAIRGVEDLSEVRVGVRYGEKRWIRVDAVKGLRTFSPSGGILITAGLVR